MSAYERFDSLSEHIIKIKKPATREPQYTRTSESVGGTVESLCPLLLSFFVRQEPRDSSHRRT